MKKPLLVLLAVIALAVCAISIPVRSQSPTPVYPVIKANVTYQNQTSTIPTTALFTPAEDGTYRISVYVDYSASVDPTSSATVQVSWSDDFQSYLQGVPLNVNFGPNSDPAGQGTAHGNQFGYGTAVARVQANTPISFDVAPQGVPVPSPYSLYIVAEKLRPVS